MATPTLGGWQRANIVAAANYLREKIAAGANDPRTRAVYEGLLEVLEPTRRLARQQREMAEATKAAAVQKATAKPVGDRRAGLERRAARDRRASADRRKQNLGPPGGIERRAVRDRRAAQARRTGRDRRAR